MRMIAKKWYKVYTVQESWQTEHNTGSSRLLQCVHNIKSMNETK